MPKELWQFLFYIAGAVAMILALILALEADVRQNSPPHNDPSDDEQNNAHGVPSFLKTDSKGNGDYAKSPVQYLIDKFRLVFEIIVAVFVGGYTITQVEQLAILSDQERRQLRAYISVGETTVRGLEYGSTPIATVKLQNSGQTPAYDVHSGASMAIRECPLTHELPGFDWAKPRSKQTIGPNMFIFKQHDRFAGGALLGEEPMRTVTSPNGAFYMFGEVRYTDIFGYHWYTRWRFFVGCGSHERGIPLAYPDEGNDAT
jgi:hypothetical protein